MEAISIPAVHWNLETLKVEKEVAAISRELRCDGNASQRNRMIKPWNQIRAYYGTFVKAGSSLRAMHELVRSIEGSRYREGVFAWTSVYDLCIVQTPVSYPYDGPYLRVSPLHDGQLEFRYVDTPVKDKQWCRVVDGRGGFAKLERFFEELHWFKD